MAVLDAHVEVPFVLNVVVQGPPANLGVVLQFSGGHVLVAEGNVEIVADFRAMVLGVADMGNQALALVIIAKRLIQRSREYTWTPLIYTFTL